MIDIHFHCLPAVDDGPKDWEQSVALCRAAATEGIEVIVATPHVLRGLWRDQPRERLEALTAELNHRLRGEPKVLLSSEYYFDHAFAEHLRSGEKIIPYPGGRYVLVEFAAHALPPMLEHVFYEVQLAGWTPVIAHPERNAVIQRKPEILDTWIAAGARMQLTAGSLTGHFGPAALKSALDALRRSATHVVASDSHSVDKRPPRWREAFDVITRFAGKEAADALMKANPEAIVAGTSLPWEPEVRPWRREGWFARLRSRLSGGMPQDGPRKN